MSQKHKNVLKQLFPVEIGENHDRDMTVEGGHLDRVQASAETLLENIFPDMALDLLYDWERFLGLSPGEDASTTARVAACLARLRETGGMSIPYFMQLAAAMGYTIKIVEPQPFMAGLGAAGDTIYDPDIVFCWRVDIQDVTVPVYYFRAGESGAGDPIMDFGVTNIESVFGDLKPAHVFVYFRYAYYEDFTVYFEQDINSHIIVTELKITFDSVDCNEDAWVRKNFGIDFFSGNFNHQLIVRATGHDDAGMAAVWAMSNTIDDLKGIQDASGDFLALIMLYDTGATAYKLRLCECDSGTLYNDEYTIAVDTEYYLAVHRDESVGSFGTLYCYIYSDTERTDLFTTLSIALHTSKKDFRYLFGVNSYNSTEAAKKLSGVVSYLKLTE
ncbi:MAG: putative phage tail protein [Thermodesulfobacteriota bacterium]|nr:putative phage tail protein [Thermodesulfobacteriota bacterium]